MDKIKKKNIIKHIKDYKLKIRNGSFKETGLSYWGIYNKDYPIEEIAARFLRRQGYKVNIEIGHNKSNLCKFGYIKYTRYVVITFKE